jgi:hypothetical protein
MLSTRPAFGCIESAHPRANRHLKTPCTPRLRFGLPLVQLRTAAGSGRPQDRQCPERVRLVESCILDGLEPKGLRVR